MATIQETQPAPTPSSGTPRVNIDSTLDSAFTTLLQKAIRAEEDEVVRPATINFMWSGGGVPLVVTSLDPILVEVPFPARLVWAHFYAGDSQGKPVPVSTAIQMQLTSVTTFGSFLPLNGAGLPPTIVTAAAADIDITDWVMNLTTGDTIVAVPQSYAGSSATWMALTLQLRPTGQAIGISDVTDNQGDLMTFSDGSPVEFRSFI